MLSKSLSSHTRSRRAGFTLIELLVTIAVVSGAFASLMALSGRFSNMLRSANDATLIAQTLQERLEMIRGSGWTVITSEEIPPVDDDATSDDATDESTDPSNEVLTDLTVFPDDLEDASSSQPGLLEAFENAAPSSAGINDLTEEVTVTKYPEGSTPIRIRRSPNGTVTLLSHNPDLVNEYMVRVVVTLTWTNSADRRTRAQSGQLIITKSSQ